MAATTIGFGPEPQAARAELVEFAFGGTIDDILGSPFGPWADVTLGDQWVLRFVFDEDTEDIDSGSITGYYLAEYAIAEIGEVSTMIEDAYVTVDLLDSEIYFGALNGPLQANGAISVFPVPIQSDALPVSFDFDLDPSLSSAFGASDGDDGFLTTGLADWWTVTVIPSPAALPLLGLALWRSPKRRRTT